jgi:type I restriction enzyme M protein
MIPACLWFIRKKKDKQKGKTLFIDARNMGHMINRKNKEFDEKDIKKLQDTYNNWRAGKDVDELGFAKSATIEEIEKQGFVLTPGRYVGTEEEVDDGISFEDKMTGFVKEYKASVVEGKKLDIEIEKNLNGLGVW